ncbi:MAG TPA: glycosyltransferase [Nitrospirae bacterium]|nr:UDP-Glc:alpha-D-GlcNAc-diphosphoundecaprenol beta-1,3-glucosyltransferase WfgD [bacterium BMS3Abin09]HDK17601.1 glycosyltransferase [Nitrospirota bacterium]
MKKRNAPDIKLVITIALKKEVPKEWFALRNISVHTLASLKAGALKSGLGMLIVITGPGLDASEEAACWIRDNLSPLFVVNIGTCGVRDKRHSLGRWVTPGSVTNEDGKSIELDTRFPLPHKEKITEIGSLLSVRKALKSGIPKEHDAVDMECYAQAEVFAGTGISFHCLKFATDYSDNNTVNDFNRNLRIYSEKTKKLFNFLILPLPRGDRERSDITVVIPVYNREQTIKRAIDSILSQSIPPKEIIVVDDASTDGAKEILEGYGNRITCITLSENSGPSMARNEGIKQAKTEWIAFLDSDDCWEPDKLKNQVEYLAKYPFYQIIQTDEKWIRNGKRVNSCRHHKKPEGWIWELSLERCLVAASALLVRKSLLEQYGMFDEAMPVCEDYDLWLKISRHHPVGLDPILTVSKYGGHRDQLSTQYPAMDRFRSGSLYRMLQSEPSAEYRQKIIDVLKEKLKIVINGYKKRNKINDAKECGEMLGSLDDFRSGV